MPLFKKSPSDLTYLLPECQRRVLRRCRMLLVKDLDVAQVVDFLSTEEGLKSDQRDAIFAVSTREQRVGVLLDQLEFRGGATFNLFMDSLKIYHKHLYAVVDEMLRTVDDDSNIERIAISGTALRRLLRKSTSTNTTTGPFKTSLSADESFDGYTDSRDDGSYIDCYVVSTHGRLQQEAWIHHSGVSARNESPTLSTYTAQLVSDLTFQRVDRTSLPSVIRQPPSTCLVYIISNAVAVPLIKKRDRESNDTPPPVPPKPLHLPSLSTISHGRLAPELPLPPRAKRDVITPPPRAKRDVINVANVTVSRAVPPVPMKKPHIIVSNGSVLAVRRHAVSTDTKASNETITVGTVEADTSLDEISEVNNEPTRMIGNEYNENQSLNYNVSACSTVEWIFGEQKKVPTDNVDTDTSVGEENQYEPVTPVASNPISNGTPAVVEPIGNTTPIGPQPLYSVVNKDRSSKSRVPNISNKEPQVVKTTLDDDVIERLSVSSEAGIMSCLRQPIKRSSSYGDLPRQASSSVGNDSQESTLANHPWLISSLLPENSSLTDSNLLDKSDLTDSRLKEELRSTDPLLPKKSWLSNQVLACETEDVTSSIDYYEDIDLCRSRSMRSARPYLEAHNTFASVNDGSHRLCRGNLLVAECVDACTLPIDSTQTTESLLPYLDTVLSFDQSGSAFYVPKSHLIKYGSPEQEPWFYPLPLTPRQATIFLSEERLEGCFVVYRPASVQDNDLSVVYHLSVCRETGDVLHYRIVENLHGDYSIVGHDHSFLTLSELITYFQCNKSTIATRLRRPLAHARLPVTPGLHYDNKYELSRSDLTLTGRIIGKGNFGVICAGIYQNKHVAIKVLHRADLSTSDEDDFIEEAKCLMSLNHEQVLQLIGVIGSSRPLYIVTEFAARGSLKDCLRNGVLPKDNLDTLFDVCIQVVSAMRYLESHHYMLHRDLAARNFLVTEECQVKLADFGRARYVIDDSYQAPRNEKICIKWSAPEVLLDSVYSTKSDVWAMGVVFWEVLSHGERPYSSLSGEQTAVYVVEGGRLDKPPGCPRDLYSIMRSCWRHNSVDRPSFAHLADKLRSKSSIYYVQLPRTSIDKLNSSEKHHRHHINRLVSPPPRFKQNAASSAALRSINSHKMRKSATANGDSIRLDLDMVDEMDRRIPVTSSSETSLSSIPGAGGLMDDIGRGDKIRKSLRKLINMKTNGKHRKQNSRMIRESELNDVRSAGFGFT